MLMMWSYEICLFALALLFQRAPLLKRRSVLTRRSERRLHVRRDRELRPRDGEQPYLELAQHEWYERFGSFPSGGVTSLSVTSFSSFFSFSCQPVQMPACSNTFSASQAVFTSSLPMGGFQEFVPEASHTFLKSFGVPNSKFLESSWSTEIGDRQQFIVNSLYCATLKCDPLLQGRIPSRAELLPLLNI